MLRIHLTRVTFTLVMVAGAAEFPTASFALTVTETVLYHLQLT